jgi:succinoglycan biosynthesis transport protein ExoP
MNDATLTRRLDHLSKGKKRKPFNPIQFALRRGPFLLGIGTFLTLLLAAFLLPRARPVYEADAVILINPAKEPTLTGRERDPIPGNLGDWTRTQITRMTSQDVIEETIHRIPLEEQPDFLRSRPGHPSNPFRVMQRVRVREVPRTYLVTLRIANDSPEGIAPLLNTLMEVYIEKLQREFELTYQRRLDYLLEEREKISGRLAVEEARLMALAEAAGSKAFLHEGYNNHLNKVEQIQRLYWEAFSRKAEAKAQMDKVIGDREQIRELSLQPFADERVADNFGINRIEQWTYEQLQQLRSTIDGLRPENPDRIYVEERMTAMNRFLEEYKQRVNEETIRNLLEKQEYELEVQVLLATSAFEAAAKSTEVLRDRLQEAQEEAARISLAIFQASSPEFMRNQLRDRLESLNNRIDDTEMEAKTPIRVSIDKRAGTPTSPSSTSAMKLLMFAVVIGFGSITAPVFLYEILDNRLRSSSEIEVALGGPGPDPIASFVSAVQQHPDFVRASLNHPGHPSTLAVRELAARFEHDHATHGSQIITLAGLHPDSGITSLGINLAHALRNLGGPVILLELNPSAPGLDMLLKLGTDQGLEYALEHSGSLESLIVHDPERDIDLLPSDGSGRPERIEEYRKLLEALKIKYPFIIVDAGGFADDLTAYACRCSDAVLLVAREKQTCYRDLRRGIDLLIQAEVPAMTAVMNFSKGNETPFVLLAIERTILQISAWMEKLPRFPRLTRSKI